MTREWDYALPRLDRFGQRIDRNRVQCGQAESVDRDGMSEAEQRVECDQGCQALEHPNSPTDTFNTLQHYKNHTVSGGCSHSHRAYKPADDEPAMIKLAESVGRDGMSEAEQEITDWWMDAAADEIRRTVRKALEYGDVDLIEIGRQIAQVGHLTLTDAQLAELGTAFYTYGKLARAMSAYAGGRWPSDDTWFDVRAYAGMVQRIRHCGGWPGTDLSGTDV
jgi:hypothetical protein